MTHFVPFYKELYLRLEGFGNFLSANYFRNSFSPLNIENPGLVDNPRICSDVRMF